MHVGKAIRDFIEKQPDGIPGAAKKLDYTVQSLYPIFRKANVNTAFLQKIADAYGVNPLNFMTAYPEVEPELKKWSEDGPEYKSTDLEAARRRIAVLEAEKKGLEEQIKLLREMVDVLKSRS
ncbi:hypothetical protein [Dyadobacter sp. 32]|uniref:hypothetical protein n=1 Tax=Dyadobacter sp. 32 TaxID=538966 RepID=UPI0011EC18F6